MRKTYREKKYIAREAKWSFFLTPSLKEKENNENGFAHHPSVNDAATECM